MADVRFSTECDAPADVTFDYVADHRNVTEYWHGMTSYVPVGAQDTGMGAVFDAVSKLGPSSLRSQIQIVEYEPASRLVFRSVSGTRSTTEYDFAPIGAGRCRIDFMIEFDLPDGIAGRAIEKSLAPFVSAAAKKTAEGIARGARRVYLETGQTDEGGAAR